MEKILNEYPESKEEREETIYLKGLIASKVKGYSKTAEEAFLSLLASYPNGKYVERSLHMLGTLYYHEKQFEKAKSFFLELPERFPHSKLH